MTILLTGGIGWNAKPSEIVKTVSANANSITVRSYFTDAEWNSIAPKRFVIPSGVDLYSNQSWGAIRVQDPSIATGYGGSLTIENRGRIFGLGGSANSGQGGDAFYSGSYAASGIKPVVENYGLIFAGGGGGGQGGQGGSGSVTQTIREPASGFTYAGGSTQWFVNTNFGIINLQWQGSTVQVGGGTGTTQATVGDYTYFRGALVASNIYQIARQGPVTTSTTGGTGGAGGRGEGSDAPLAGGSAGSAGGTNAGSGGTGGSGGAYGNQGSTGGTGSAGNVGSGSAGSAGGLAGVAYNTSTVTMQNSGDIRGRVI